MKSHNVNRDGQVLADRIGVLKTVDAEERRTRSCDSIFLLMSSSSDSCSLSSVLLYKKYDLTTSCLALRRIHAVAGIFTDYAALARTRPHLWPHDPTHPPVDGFDRSFIWFEATLKDVPRTLDVYVWVAVTSIECTTRNVIDQKVFSKKTA